MFDRLSVLYDGSYLSREWRDALRSCGFTVWVSDPIYSKDGWYIRVELNTPAPPTGRAKVDELVSALLEALPGSRIVERCTVDE
jgi:hypothetical protein